MRTISIVLFGAARYIKKWLPRRLRRAMECAKACHDFVPGPGARNIGTGSKLANRLNKGVPIDARLSRAKFLGGPFEDVGEVDFRSSAETNAPSPLGHDGPIRRFAR
jgi:hypothetical protein